MKNIIFIFILLLTSISAAQNTYVPDDHFEAYLEANGMGNGVANDDYVTTANIENVTNLNVSNQNISDLTGIEDFMALTTLNCNSNHLNQINVSQNTALVQFYCGSNQLTTLDVSSNVNLENLICSHNQLSQIDLSQNIALTDLGVYNNQLTSLDISHNIHLVNLQVQSNGLTSLDVGQNSALETLWCHNNQLTDLDLTNNPTLHNIRCDVNQLSNLDVRNGNNVVISVFNAQHNPDLTCIYVDDSNASYLSSWAIDGTEAFVANDTECDLQTRWTYVPDDNFENYLETHSATGAIVPIGDNNSMGNGIANDNYVPTGKIENVTNLTIGSRHISDLTGIEDFTQLQNLDCSYNTLSSFDLSQNTNLVSLDCRNNTLTDINTINNQALNRLICYQNALTSIDVTQNTNLITLSCSNNQISSLDLSHNAQLENLSCQDNHISNINLSGLTNLIRIKASNNLLTGLDLSQNAALTMINCNNNQLTDLNVKNGQNTNISDTNFNATNNPDLTCIEVDNAAWSTTHWTQIDATANFSEDCSVVYYSLTVNTTGNGNVSPNSGTYADGSVVTLTATPDAGWEFAGWSGDLSGNTNPTSITMDADKNLTATFTRIQHTLTVNHTGNGSVSLSPAGGTYNEGTTVTLTATPDAGWEFTGWSGDLSGTTNPASITMDADKNITATFNQLAQTYVPDNNFEHYLEHHDADGNVVTLGASNSMGNGVENDNYVTTANINTVTQLIINNQNIADLTGIADFTALSFLNCNYNQLTVLDVSHNLELGGLYCVRNQLTALDVSQNTVLIGFECSMNQLTTLDVSHNPGLTKLYCDHNQLTALDVSQNTALTKLDCYYNQLTTLDVSQNTALTKLFCHSNQLTALDVSQNTALTKLDCYLNQITDLDVSYNPSLTELYCDHNQLTGLNVKNGHNASIPNNYFDASVNPDLTCILVDDPAWSDINWTKIDSTSHFVANQTECDNLSIDDEVLRSALKVFPNPVNNRLTIQSETYQDMVISIYSLIGQKLIDQKSNNGQSIVNLKSLPAATYIVKITIDSRSVYYNIVKE